MLSFSVVFVCLQQQTETRIQMIKMVNEFKLTVVHFARPNPMQICACAWIYRWTEKPWKMRSGLPGRRAAGPSRAVGRGPLDLRAAGPLGRGGPWAAGRRAAGLLLAKPQYTMSNNLSCYLYCLFVYLFLISFIFLTYIHLIMYYLGLEEQIK